VTYTCMFRDVDGEMRNVTRPATPLPREGGKLVTLNPKP